MAANHPLSAPNAADRLLLIAPEFALFLLETPEEARVGPVFRLDGRQGRYRDWEVSKIVSKIGKAAGVKVYGNPKDPEKVKYASAHDFRRAFGVRWAARLMPAQLMELMRHESIETTLRFYVGTDAQRTAEAAWAAFEAVQRVFGGSFANSFANSATSGGGEAAPPELRYVRENTARNESRPGVIRTHDQGIMRTKVVLGGTWAKTDVFGVSPAKASDLVQWDEFGICPGTVPYVSNCGGFGRTPKPLLRSSPALRQPKRSGKLGRCRRSSNKMAIRFSSTATTMLRSTSMFVGVEVRQCFWSSRKWNCVNRPD
jgi:hypothetical protein